MKYRYRLGYEGRAIQTEVLVLQVLKHFDGEMDSYGNQAPGYDKWVDARLEDITEGIVLGERF